MMPKQPLPPSKISEERLNEFLYRISSALSLGAEIEIRAHIAAIEAENATLREIAKTATSKLWGYCPECGSEETHYEGGRHNWCQSCGQEWFVDIDYSDTVPEVLQIRIKERDALKAKVERYAEALRFYTQENNYELNEGEIARTALAENGK